MKINWQCNSIKDVLNKKETQHFLDIYKNASKNEDKKIEIEVEIKVEVKDFAYLGVERAWKRRG